MIKGTHREIQSDPNASLPKGMHGSLRIWEVHVSQGCQVNSMISQHPPKIHSCLTITFVVFHGVSFTSSQTAHCYKDQDAGQGFVKGTQPASPEKKECPTVEKLPPLNLPAGKPMGGGLQSD